MPRPTPADQPLPYDREFRECIGTADAYAEARLGTFFTGRWRSGCAEHLVGIGVLREAELAEWWFCERCVGITGKVQRFYEDERGVRMAKVWCMGEKFHADEVEAERLRQWAVSLEGVGRLVAAAIAAKGPVETLVTDRVVRVGVAHSGASVSDVFLVRGAQWADARQALGGCREIRTAHAPLVFCLHDAPEPDLWPDLSPAVFSLPSVATLHGDELRIPRDLVLARESVPHAEGGGDWLFVTEAAKLVLDVVSDTDLAKARVRVSGAVSRGSIRSNGLAGVERRLEPGSLMRWLFEQRNRDLAKEDLR